MQVSLNNLHQPAQFSLPAASFTKPFEQSPSPASFRCTPLSFPFLPALPYSPRGYLDTSKSIPRILSKATNSLFFFLSSTARPVLDSRLPDRRTPGLCPMANAETPQVEDKHAYSVWAVPPDDVAPRLKKLMEGVRSEFGGPKFEPHITVVGAIRLTPEDALRRFRSSCEGLKSYTATVDRVATGTFPSQCLFLLIHPTAKVVETSAHCSGHFGYKRSYPYMPHLSLLYGDLTDDEKRKAQEKANVLDESINSLSFPITRLALYKTDPFDQTLESWEKIAECSLSPNWLLLRAFSL